MPALDTYFRERVNQDQKRSISVAYVLVENVLVESASERIVGYYTLSNAALEPAELPPDLARKLPRYETYGAILIGRLALDRRYQGQGFGRRLLSDALSRCLAISQQTGAYAVLVDAKDDTARAFYEHIGFQRLLDDEYRLFIPMTKLELLLKAPARMPTPGPAAR